MCQLPALTGLATDIPVSSSARKSNRMPRKPVNHSTFLRLLLGTALMAMVTGGLTPIVGEIAAAQEPAQQSADEQPTEESAEIRRLINDLGATSFRAREAATAGILTIGPKALPLLRQMKDSGDPEMKQRIEILTERLVNDDFERRATAFLDGEEGASLPGWEYAAPRLGNAQEMREIFVQFSRRHPGAVMLLDGDRKERKQALEIISNDIGPPIMDPNAADAIGLAMLRSDPDIEAQPICDGLLFSLLNRYEVTDVLRDPEVNRSVRELLESWTKQVSTEHQYSAINLALQWRLKSTPELARKILETNNDVVILQSAMRVLAATGKPSDAAALKPFLDDKRTDPNGFFYTDAGGRRLKVLLGDVAMATIAALHERNLRDLGFPAAQTHPALAFDVDSLGFPEGEEGDQARARVRQDIDELLEES